MWLGALPDVPHGVFNPQDFTNICYQGEVLEMPILPQSLIDILLMPISIPSHMNDRT
jgi:hypothetical protein